MKHFTSAALLCTLLIAFIFTFEGCDNKGKDTYCSFAIRSNRCDIAKDKVLCFKCNGNDCPVLANQQVYIKRGENDSCLVSLGNKITDCKTCPKEDSVVTLLSIVK